MTRQLLATCLLVVTLTFGCGKQGQPDKITMVEADDDKMNAAMETARKTVDTFIKALRSPKPSQKSFSVKMAFKEGDSTEHMWLTDVSYDGTKFHGWVNNDPGMVKNVKNGDKVTVTPA